MSPDVLTERWYAVVNDLVGGWCVATVDMPLSEFGSSSTATFVGDFLTEGIARHVADLHNASLEVAR